MTYRTNTLKNQEITAIDILTMESMDIDSYRRYLEDDLFMIDHSNVLRSNPAGYPLAVTKEQMTELINHLESLKDQLR